MLHIVNKSPSERANLQSCLRHAQPGAAVLLIEDGVYGALKGTLVADELRSAKNLRIYALREDIDARGIGGKVVDGITLIDYGGFVDLVVEHSPIMAWL
jgi:tRNA 2-thiouridine synthesizing protein B